LVTFAGLRNQNTPLPSHLDRILIVKLDRIGDMVNTTPVFDFLKKLYPEAKIDLVAHPATLALFEEDSRITTLLPYKSSLYHDTALTPPGRGALKLTYALWRLRYPMVVYLRGSFPFLLLAMRSRFVSAKFLKGEPVIQRYFKPLGVTFAPGSAYPRPRLHVSPTSRNLVLTKYPHLLQRRTVVIHAISAAAGKQWPAERFAHVADELNLKAHAEILFLAAPSEAKKLSHIKSLCKQSHQFETELSLPEVVAAIAEASVFIGNDSGLAHIAAAVGTPEVVIWGAANLNMARPIASADRCTILYRELSCRATCPEIRCSGPKYLDCLLSIDEQEVVNSALIHLQAAPTKGTS
jgi:ADP-heptose:LPS heptosyltransferase